MQITHEKTTNRATLLRNPLLIVSSPVDCLLVASAAVRSRQRQNERLSACGSSQLCGREPDHFLVGKAKERRTGAQTLFGTRRAGCLLILTTFLGRGRHVLKLLKHGAATTPLPYVAKLTYIPECEKSSGRFRRLRRFFSKLTRRNSTSDDSDSEQLLEDGMPMTSDCSWYSSQPIFF
ncbi:hypothetical protein L596_001972 [Steinernema carpocapsae]|uniref:Uncharacterized protein n=1 Tax=Steinernema carpocapsae TaxID=34508 RepID=A0A4U8URR1_STECR|nr:hypothetical protein L596_001972 [Steinernema carpocapsae]